MSIAINNFNIEYLVRKYLLNLSFLIIKFKMNYGSNVKVMNKKSYLQIFKHFNKIIQLCY